MGFWVCINNSIISLICQYKMTKSRFTCFTLLLQALRFPPLLSWPLSLLSAPLPAPRSFLFLLRKMGYRFRDHVQHPVDRTIRCGIFNGE